ncbi:glycosyl hydrolase family 10 [Labilibaculum sp. A4]|uniref:endo-1,4-beta-xylanase n=1 Tax=Labilibaculum euxinus TaxID=2686357 RepID=UPI000F62495A|nr:endo-1,4-beta-xylanase [Labilibaculum euxinus]MDQ1771064.1 endo-1,4-beta-xylanase [Labilibaculum euxinus]MWN76929.1 glycosyl hydrolase family 10 [Labilibaculum euxinus]
MKYIKILPVIAVVSMIFSSCDDQIMDWYTDPTHGEVSIADLPLELAEKISRYETLNTYTDFTLGVGIGLDQYMNNEAYRNLTNENFDEVTVGYAMKHKPMVNSKGEIGFDKVDAFIAKTKEAGLSVFGHTLVWHSNQNASYLNGLIASTVIPASGGSNSLDLSGLKDGTLTGWGAWNSGDGISVEDGAGLSSSSQAVKMIAGSSSAQAYELQLITPEIPVVSGHTYEISFYIKSDQAGKGRISFSGLENNYPYKDWYSTGGSWTEAFETSTQWQQVKFTVNDFTGVTFKMNFDLGYLPGVTYLIDVDNIKVVDQDAVPEVVNMIANGTFDEGIDGWAKWNGGDTALSLADAADAYEGNGAMKVIADAANSGAGNQWKTQIHSDFTANLTAGEEYTISYFIKSEAAGSVRCSTTGSAHYQGDQATSPTWQYVEWVFTADGGETGLNFDLGGVEGTYYVDNVVVTTGAADGGDSGPTIIEKTDEEKSEIIGNAMENWITGMVTHYNDNIHAWDVVNEPMKEDGTLRDGNVTDPASDYFSWVKYLGKDYAVTAFKLARQNGNTTDKLFINDYNLESSISKCEGLIEYVEYIESQGATVDGIGTQMHISINSDRDKIAEMFQKLAASGKLIKISELDVRLGTKNPTVAQLASQADMYQYVLDMYMKYIPVAQQYGVTIWGISDNEDEHEYWLPDESPNLWDADYNRKHAFKGVCDGLAGRDVSEDFSGELEY